MSRESYARGKAAPRGTRFAESGNFVPFDKALGYRVVDAARGSRAARRRRSAGGAGAVYVRRIAP